MTTLQTPKKIIKIDASAARESSCFLRTKLSVIDGYSSPFPTNDMEYGSAFHRFFELYYNYSGDVYIGMQAAVNYYTTRKDMIVKPRKGWLNAKHLTQNILRYSQSYPFQHDILRPVAKMDGTNNKAVEVKFAIPYYSTAEVDVLLCGTMDMLCSDDKGRFMIVDHKTTSIWNIPDFLDGFKLSCQFLVYLLAIKYLAARHPNSVFGKIISEQREIGFIVNGVFLKANVEETTFQRSDPIYYSDEMLHENRMLLDSYVRRLAFQVANPDVIVMREGMFNGACNTPYGKCKYFDSCSAKTTELGLEILRGRYIQKEYDPLMFGKD